MSEMRLDVAMVQRGVAPSRERARETILAGMVRLNGRPAAKPALKVRALDQIEVTGDPIGYVGRGGLKLEAALDRFGLNPSGLVCMDVGASTGGFTDCLLRRGARLVYAIDVGRAQLHHSLRSDPRVVVMEGTDIRVAQNLPELPSLTTVDLSFISLTLVLPSLAALMATEGAIVALIKPQFEVGPGGVGKGGIVRDPRARQRAVEKVLGSAAALGLKIGKVIDSPILGTEGNQEYLTIFRYLPSLI